MRRSTIAVILASFALVAAARVQPARELSLLPMNTIAERYVKLVLAVGPHDAAYVDAYYGPAEWKAEAERQKRSLVDIDAEAERLIRDAGPRPASTDSFV